MAVDTDARTSVAADDAHASGASGADADVAVDMTTDVKGPAFCVLNDSPLTGQA